MSANWENRTLLHGDNLSFLRTMNSGSVHLIATDPPFNKGRDFHATPDSLASGASFQDRWSWDKDIHQDWVDKIEDDFPRVMEAITWARGTHSDGMGAFLCFMAVRLLEMKRILRDDGSIYLHCDSTASHYLKAVMDAVFGSKNFRNSIAWLKNDGRAKGSQHKPKIWGTQYDTILFYAKSSLVRVQPYRDLTKDEADEQFPKVGPDGRRYKKGIPLWCQPSMGPRPNLCYTWRGFTNPHPSGWRLSKARMEEEYQKGNIVIVGESKLERRLYLDDYKGSPVGDLWDDISPAKGNERTGFPTQKPLRLYERIIKASSNEGDIILDPFCGCSTTLLAAENLNRQWVGIDIWDKAHKTVIDRLVKESNLAGPADETGGRVFVKGKITYSRELLIRTDAEDETVPFLRTKQKIEEPKEKYKTKGEKKAYLLEQYGFQCQGCYRKFDEPLYLVLDHNTPRADGGIDHTSNRVLLCHPCNNIKGHILTLSGLRRENKKRGRMADQGKD